MKRPPVKVSYLKMNWYKNSGSQEICIKEFKDHMVLLAVHTIKGRMWGLCDRADIPDKLSKNRGIYEVILNKKRKVYFDIDSYDVDTLTDCVKEIKNVLPDAKLNISGSVFIPNEQLVQNGRTKYSYHIVVQNYYLENLDDSNGLREFCRKFESIGMDYKVYTKNRQMKCIGQSKPRREIQKYISGSTRLHDHLITEFFDNDCRDAREHFKKYETDIIYNRIKQTKKALGKNVLKPENYTGEPLELVRLIPNNYEHSVTFTVALYYLSLGYDFEKFWEWTKTKDDSIERYNKLYNYTWPDASNLQKTGQNKVTKNSIIKILERYFPNIRKDYYTRLFLDNSMVLYDVDIKRQYLKQEDFSRNHKINYVTTPMGSGKTQAVVDFVSNTFESCIFVNCRTSLAQNIKGRLPDKFVSYDNVSELKKVCESNGLHGLSTTKNRNEIKVNGIPMCHDLIITPNSVYKVGDRKYDILIIDEFEMYQSCWISDDTHTISPKNGEKINNYAKNWETMTRLIKEAKKVILLDALPSRNAFFFLNKMGYNQEHINIIGSSFEYPKLRIIDIELSHPENPVCVFLQQIVKLLTERKKVYIFWPYKTPIVSDKDPELKRLSCNQMIDYVIGNSGREDIKYIIYTADTNKGEVKKGLLDVDKTWEDIDIIVVNQSVTIGVNYSIPDNFDSIFIADSSFVSTRELVQTSRRVRKTTSGTLYYVDLGGYKPTIHQKGPYVDEYNVDCVENIINEKKGKGRTTTHSMFETAHMDFVIDKESLKNLPTLYDKYLVDDKDYSWRFIPDIRQEDTESLERLCIYGAECCEDVLKLAKFKFRKLFDETIPEFLIADMWGQKSKVDKIFKYFNTTKPDYIEEITDQLNLTDPHNIKSKVVITLPSHIRDNILKKYSFNELDPAKINDTHLSAKVINNYFSTTVFKYNKDRGAYIMDQDFFSLFAQTYHWNISKDQPMFDDPEEYKEYKLK